MGALVDLEVDSEEEGWQCHGCGLGEEEGRRPPRIWRLTVRRKDGGVASVGARWEQPWARRGVRAAAPQVWARRRAAPPWVWA